MKLQVKKERWQCAIASFAMAMNLTLDDLIERLGDGSQVIFPHLPEPTCRRGHNIFELIDEALRDGLAVTPVPLFPAIAAADKSSTFPIGNEQANWDRFQKHVLQSRGVIAGIGSRCEHMVAYDHGRIFDPDGEVYDYSRPACEQRHFYTYQLYRVDRICDVHPREEYGSVSATRRR